MVLQVSQGGGKKATVVEDGISDAAECVFFIHRSMPTANAEDLCQSEGISRRFSPETFPTPPSDSIQPLDVRRRRAPKL